MKGPIALHDEDDELEGYEEKKGPPLLPSSSDAAVSRRLRINVMMLAAGAALVVFTLLALRSSPSSLRLSEAVRIPTMSFDDNGSPEEDVSTRLILDGQHRGRPCMPG